MMVPEEDAKNCWEYFGCPKSSRKECVVFQLDMGQECYLLGHLKAGNTKLDRMGVQSCFDCPWYKKKNP